MSIIATRIVNDGERLKFLPANVGASRMLRFESLVYQTADQLVKGYNGGFWHYIQLDNGGFYMSPAYPEPISIRVDGNGFEGDVSTDAAGIIVTLFALNRLLHMDSNDLLIQKYYALQDFAGEHPEARLIFAAID